MKQRDLKIRRNSAIFRCVVTLKNGLHKTLRLTIDKVAKMCAAVRQMRELPELSWMNERYSQFFDKYGIVPSQFSAAKFINERTGEELVSIAL